jgi:hypothetical protein
LDQPLEQCAAVVAGLDPASVRAQSHGQPISDMSRQGWPHEFSRLGEQHPFPIKPR